jgi:hypothetical protein
MNSPDSRLVTLITVSFLAVVGTMVAVAWNVRDVPINAGARRRRSR